jgi:hypothetical protein
VKHFWLRRLFSRHLRKRSPDERLRRTWVPRLERLEDRWVPTITVINQAIAATEGVSGIFTVATFTDSDPSPVGDYTATIDWGDGSTTAGNVTLNGTTFSVMGTHTYADETDPASPLPVTVQIQENNPPDMDTGTANSTAAVAEADSLTAGTVAITATEGTAFSGTLATFTNSNPANSSTDFTATVVWGDGTTTTGTVSGSGGSFTVSGTHTYLEDGSFAVSVTLADDSPSSQSATATGTVDVSENDLAVTGSTITPTEGQTFSGAVASITDTGSPDAASAFGATIAWGDGTSSAGTVTGSGGSFSVSGTHVYADEGSFTGSVQITETGVTGGTQSAGLTANVAEGDVLTGTGKTLTATEKQAFSGAVATFTDTNTTSPASDFTASIVWGDGTTTTGTVTGGAGNFTVSGTHTYAEDGSLSLNVTLSENSPGTATGSATSTATIGESDLSATLTAISATEGHTFTGTVATFTDTGSPDAASAFTATIDWGDSSTTTGTVTGSGGNFSVTGTHVYADEGTFTGSVQVAETGITGGTASSTLNATVAEGDTLAGTGKTLTATEGHSFSGAVATFTNTNTTAPATDFTASIDWGDGTTTTGTVTGSAGSFTVNGTHTFAEDGSLSVKVTLTDDNPGTATALATSTADIAENDLTATAATIAATEGHSFSGTVATFTDTGSPEAASAFTASIDWGDGTSSTGTVSGSAGSFTVKGTHTYTDEGSFTARVQITETGVTSGTASASSTAQVSEADVLSATATAVTATQGQAFHGLVATFSSTNTSNTASDFSAMINWGDGSTTTGTVSGANGSFTVSGEHTYASTGTFPVSVTIKDDGAGTATVMASSTATTTGQAWLDRVYRDLFHRVVDPTGQVGWTTLLNRGVSRQIIMTMIEQSLEFRTDEVQNLYQELLHRSADPTGINVNVSALAAGATILDIEQSILGSAEFFANAGGTNQGFVNALFEIVLHRAPEPGVQSLAVNALNNGMSRQAVAAVVLSSDEFRGDLINHLYEQYLFRASDPGGFALSMQGLRTGFTEEGLIAVLLGSDEYFMSTTD